VMGLIAQQRLESNIHGREAGAKKGILTDPFFDESQRDFGQAQTAAIVGGELTLPVLNTDAKYVSTDVTAKTTIAFTPVASLSQTIRTGEMAVNAYLNFSPIPASVTLVPNVDRWTEVQEDYTGPVTHRFSTGSGNLVNQTTATTTNLVSSSESFIEVMRPVQVSFSISGFGPNEKLIYSTMDGIEITTVAN